MNLKITYAFFDTGLEFRATKEHLQYLEQEYDIHIEQIKNKILERNSTIRSDDEKLISQQLVYFKYNDSKASMLKLGWIVYKKGDIDKFTKCGFGDFEFYNSSNIPYDISVPNFTYKELAILNQNMPNVVYPIEGADFLGEEEVNAYRKIYKYYPTTFETSIALQRYLVITP